MSISLLKKRILKDNFARSSMFILTILSLFLLIFIGVGLYMKSRLILEEHSLWTLLSTAEWKPLRGSFGFLPFIIGTLAVTALSITIALPISLLTALYLTEYAHAWIRRVVFPVLDILAGIPSVVYGVWGTLIIVPWIADKLGPHFVDYTSGYTVLASGIVLGVMILPLLISLFIEIFTI
ncbi:MAG: phosphate ABC transporter permease subunit PstC, partial [Bacteroidales bacterium]